MWRAGTGCPQQEIGNWAVVSHGTPELHRLAERGVPEGPIACGGAGEGGAGSNLVLHPSLLLFVPIWASIGIHHEQGFTIGNGL